MKKLFLLSGSLMLSASVFAQTTVKKVIIEDYTGGWCGWCPEGTVILEGLEAQYPTQMIPIANHNGDALQTAEGAAVDAALNVTSYPNGSVDRKLFSGEPKTSFSRGKWTNYFNQRKAETAKVSVGFANKKLTTSTGTYEADIKVKFVSQPTAGVPLKVQVYILEDSIPATGNYYQLNFSSSIQGGKDTLSPWFHNATLRDALGGNWGFATAIPATPVVGTEYTQPISFTIPAGWVKKHIQLVAFVAYDGAVASGQKEILNSEEVKLSSFFPTSVNDLKDEVSFINTYPNPASANQVVKIEYNIEKSSVVSLKVYNALGQLVASPYISNEVVGTHTIHWRPSENGLTSGIYILELATENGKKVQRLNLK
ncbi:MAG TPA: Omp28-related outer membrane protein [Flavipsychrobacter sp.]|nr:Omp28-related outer membrane protein [Flavipsychrobacter sp.]